MSDKIPPDLKAALEGKLIPGRPLCPSCAMRDGSNVVREPHYSLQSCSKCKKDTDWRQASY